MSPKIGKPIPCSSSRRLEYNNVINSFFFFGRTFEYVQRELEKIPKTIPVLVLGNHCDMSHHRCVTADHVLYFLEVLQR